MESVVPRYGHLGAILAALFLFIFLSAPVIAHGQVVGTSALQLPAVILYNNTGSLTNFTLTVTNGNGTVSITGPEVVGNTTLDSAITAAQYASSYLGKDFYKYNFTYHIGGNSENVSGPSGGAGMTMLAISALEGRPLLKTFSMTGTISSNGTIGAVGGVYEKSMAVKHGGLAFFLVPQVGNDSVDAELYLLIQDAVGIPVIQVSNISQVTQFAFTNMNVSQHRTTFSFYNRIDVAAIPDANITCSNSCNMSAFRKLANYTFAFVNSSINTISQQKFSNVSQQLHASLAQSEAIADKGYLYAGADFAFLNYPDAAYFNSYRLNESQGFAELQAINATCRSLAPQQLTTNNYEYVIGGQLRQAWGTESINETVLAYSSVETTDDVLYFMRVAATSNAWCNAANEMFGIGKALGGNDVIASANLSYVANERMARASSYGPNIYFLTAQQAMAAKNYPVAIIDADYAYAISNASEVGGSNITTPELLADSASLASNATFGVWATQFANSAEFYAHASEMASNASSARGYADSAYSSALLASTISMDMRLINSSLVPGTGTQAVVVPASVAPPAPQPINSGAVLDAYLAALQQAVYNITFVLFVVIIAASIIIGYFFVKIRDSERVIARLQKTGKTGKGGAQGKHK